MSTVGAAAYSTVAYTYIRLYVYVHNALLKYTTNVHVRMRKKRPCQDHMINTLVT